MIEHRLGSAADNPMLFLMALSLSGDGVPRRRAEVYEQFIRGLVARAGVADDDVGLAALGVAWAEMIGRDQRAADHYSWRLALGTALDGLAALPAWRGHTSTAETAMATAKRTGLLNRRDPDSRARASARLVRRLPRGKSYRPPGSQPAALAERRLRRDGAVHGRAGRAR